jgi:hypothetical protein
MTALRVFEMLHAQVFERLPQAPLSAQPEASAVWDVRNVLAAQKRRVRTSTVRGCPQLCPVLRRVLSHTDSSAPFCAVAQMICLQLHMLPTVLLSCAHPPVAVCVQVLEGVELVFSRVIPLETNPRQHPLWLLAEQYGATCSEQCTEETTHVVAMTGGTEKVRITAQPAHTRRTQQIDCLDGWTVVLRYSTAAPLCVTLLMVCCAAQAMWARQHKKHVVGPAW